MRLILALIAAALPAAPQQAISLLALDRQGQPLLDLRYLLTFQTAAKPAGSFHPIRVTCNRPGMRLQSPQGYFLDK